MVAMQETLLKQAIEAEIIVSLKTEVGKVLQRLPLLFDHRLSKGLDRLIANTSYNFLSGRSFFHLKEILLAQFFHQKKMEQLIEGSSNLHKHLLMKLFRGPSRICISLCFTASYGFHREQILKALHILLPGIHEMPGSFYLWHHPDLPYVFCYLEIHKLRGKELSQKELKKIEKDFREELLSIPPLTPAVFWPYNKEESYRQIQLLISEMQSPEDLPHVSLHFQEQTTDSLEFLIHIVRPQSPESMDELFKFLPESFYLFCHFLRKLHSPLLIEVGVFSIQIPSNAFDVRDSINLLYARRYVLKVVESIIGPFRDYNGGLFEKQQEHFETIRVHLSGKIPHFDLFAEKVFYALHPVEMWLSLSLREAEDLFTAFSQLMQEKEPFAIKSCSETFTIIKTLNAPDLFKLSRFTSESKLASHAYLSFGGYHYFCLLNPGTIQIDDLLKEISFPREKTKTLRLVFQEGSLPSLNPHYSSGDMRCKMLSKLVFEGLTRLNAEREPELAGARECEISKDGLQYTFKLRPFCWSNGENVTAFDYTSSWQSALSDHVNHPEVLFSIKNAKRYKEKKCSAEDLGIKALDVWTLFIELEKPNPLFLYELAQPFYFPMFGTFREPKWFNGPFIIRNQTKEGMVLERNPYFWNRKRVFFEQIEIRWTNDSETIFEDFKHGNIDWIGDPLNALSPEFAQYFHSEGKLKKYTPSRRFYLYFNTTNPLLPSSIRKALSLSIDRTSICKEIYLHSSPLSPLLPDKEEANRLFSEGLKELGLTRETFPPLTFTFSNQAQREHLALHLKSNWEEILGIKVNLERVEWNQFRSRIEKGFFEICVLLQDTLKLDSPEYLERFEGFSSWNFSQWVHFPYRRLVDQAREDKDPEIKESALEILKQETPHSPLFDYTHLYATDLKDTIIDSEGCIDFSWAKK